jgi:hypothetical protein
MIPSPTINRDMGPGSVDGGVSLCEEKAQLQELGFEMEGFL